MIRKAPKYTRARSEVGLSRLPVTEEIAGSNPVGPAKFINHPQGCFLLPKNRGVVVDPYPLA